MYATMVDFPHREGVLVEVSDTDAEYDPQNVVARYAVAFNNFEGLNKLLAANGYRVTRDWYAISGGLDPNNSTEWRTSVEPQPTVQPPETDVTELITKARQQNRAALDRLNDGPAPSEADEMLVISETMALRALQAADKARAEASVGNRDYTKNHTYMKARAALDAHCEQLAHLMWIRKHHAAGGSAISKYPSAADAEKYLRDLAEKEQA